MVFVAALPYVRDYHRSRGIPDDVTQATLADLQHDGHRLRQDTIAFVHAPKTIDNDLVENDHTPGFISAAEFVAGNTGLLFAMNPGGGGGGVALLRGPRVARARSGGAADGQTWPGQGVVRPAP